MVKLTISKGLTLALSGRVDDSVIRLPRPGTLAVSAREIPFIRPKLLVKEGETVLTGTPLFCDKRDKHIRYLSPGTGTVKQIRFGERRRLLEVVIATNSTDEYVSHDPVSPERLKGMTPPELADALKKGGVWQHLRQMPAMDTADAGVKPPMVMVSLNGNDLSSPSPGIFLKNRMKEYRFGLKLLEKFADRIVVTARESSLDDLADAADTVTHKVPDLFPAWDPKVVLYHLKTGPRDNPAWCVSLEGLVMMAQFLLTGIYPAEKLVTVIKHGAVKPHLRVRQGTPIRLLAGRVHPGDLITTGRFNGRIAGTNDHLGFFENTLNILPEGGADQMFGFVKPGLDAPTVSNTFLSRLFPADRQPDCTLHGENRACINCGYCETVCPVDLMPHFIMKALVGDDIEEALQMGLMDCAQCGLCSFACPSKIELTHILAQGMASHHKDKA